MVKLITKQSKKTLTVQNIYFQRQIVKVKRLLLLAMRLVGKKIKGVNDCVPISVQSIYIYIVISNSKWLFYQMTDV